MRLRVKLLSDKERVVYPCEMGRLLPKQNNILQVVKDGFHIHLCINKMAICLNPK